MLLQQGDVLLTGISKIPVNGKKLNHLTLAIGEATGHSHTITKGKAELVESNKKWYLKVLSEEAILTHQEHKPIAIPKGEYEIGIVQEYNHFEEEIKNVRD